MVQPEVPATTTAPPMWERATESPTTIINSLGILWGLGMLGMALRLGISYFKLIRLKGQLSPIRDERVQAIWNSLRETNDTAPLISLAQIDGRCSPFAFGFWHPHIVIPNEMISDGRPQEIKDALLHELNHIVNRDLWIAVLQKVTLTLYWWNPVVSWLEQQFCLSREKLCDIAVVAHTNNPKAYATTLVSLADRLNGFAALPGPTTRMATSFSLLEERIKNIATNKMTMKTPRIKRLTWTACSAAVLIGLLTFGIKATWASPQQALATLKSKGNETVQLSIADNTIELTVRNPNGTIQTVQLPISDKAKAAELIQLIGNINSDPSSTLPVETPATEFGGFPSESSFSELTLAPDSSNALPAIAESSSTEVPSRFARTRISETTDLTELSAAKPTRGRSRAFSETTAAGPRYSLTTSSSDATEAQPRRERTTAFSESTLAKPTRSRTTAFSESAPATRKRGRSPRGSRATTAAPSVHATGETPAIAPSRYRATTTPKSYNTGSSLNPLRAREPQLARPINPHDPRVVPSLNAAPAIEPVELAAPIQPPTTALAPAIPLTQPVVPATPANPNLNTRPILQPEPAPLPSPRSGSSRRKAGSDEADLRAVIESLEVRLKALESLQRRVQKYGANDPLATEE